MIIHIKKLITEESLILQDVQNSLKNGLNIQNQNPLRVQRIQKKQQEDQQKEINSLEESLILTKKRHFEGAINPNDITKGKPYRDLADVEQSGSSHAAGLSGKDEMGETMSRAKELTETTLTGTNIRGLPLKGESDNSKKKDLDNKILKKAEFSKLPTYHDRAVGGKIKNGKRVPVVKAINKPGIRFNKLNDIDDDGKRLTLRNGENNTMNKVSAEKDKYNK